MQQDNDTNNTTDVEKALGMLNPLPVQIILALVVGSTSLLTVIGNLVVIRAYMTTRALQTYTNIYIVNLAILDLIGGLFPMPIYGAYWVLGVWPLGLPMCDFYLWVNHTTLHATSYAILIIAIDRYRSVVKPIKHFQQRTWRYALVWISFCYITSLLLWTPTIFIWPAVAGRSFPPSICQPEYTNNFGFAAFAQLAVFWIPVVALVFLYTKVYRVYKQRMGQKKRHQIRNMTVKTSEIDSGISSTKNTDDTVVDSGISSTKNTDDTVVSPDDSSSTPSGHQPTSVTESPKLKKENNRAVRTLSFLFIVYLASGVPWAVLVIVFKLCPTCIPLALYQV